MRTLHTLVMWTLLLVLVAWPFLLLLSIPFRVVGIVFGAILALVKALLFLSARRLGHRGACA